MHKSIVHAFLIVLGLLFLAPPAANAADQKFPDHPIKFVVPYAAGGSTDVLARILAEALSQELNGSVVVFNQPGGGGGIGTSFVGRSPADGYTWLMATNGTHAINVSLYPSLSYDPVKDFAPVSLVAAVPLVLVVPASSPVKSLKDLIALGRGKPGGLNFGSAGIGSSGHLAAEMLKIEAKMPGSHIPFKGDGPALVDLMSGRLDFSFTNLPAAVNQIRDGRLRALAVTTAQRSAELPDVPTVAESGYPSLQVDPWYGVLVPAGTDPALVNRLSQAIDKALKTPSVRQRIVGLGATPIGTTPAEFAGVIKRDTDKFREVIRISGARAE
ncbi:Bug family tripartite tricarboxylate transporter substrate binding protein [Bordetella bronchialis]|uniref:Bug family tripartite tricarboxylate transporter substrate binding protein n=1 Tax=Bordetella bronchialis TaxID=463025 RepID=UPI003D02CCB3